MKFENWTVSAKGDCITVDIATTVDITKSKLTLLSEERTPICSMPVTSHTITICSHINRPIFAQLDDSVRYVTGSGAEAYTSVPYTT